MWAGKLKKLPYLLFFLPSLAFGASQTIGDQWRGLNNGAASVRIGDNEAQDLSNVDITEGQTSVKKRSGYATFKSLTVSTSGVVGGYYFKDAAGSNEIIHAHDVYVSKSVDGAAYSNFITTETRGSYSDFTDSNGTLWRANSSRDEIWSYTGAAVTYYPSHPKGNQIEVLPDRLVISGTSANPNRINFSAQADFTDFTTGNNPEDGWADDITLPGQAINCLKYAGGQLLAWTRTSMFVGVGENQSNFIYDNISETIGCNQPNSVLFDNGQVFWQAQDRHFYAYDFNTVRRISQAIAGSIPGFPNGEARSWSQTTESDFEAGSHTETSDDVSEGNVVLSTWTDNDTSQSDFGAGTLTNVATDTVSGSLYLSVNNTDVANNGFENGSVNDADNWTTNGGGDERSIGITHSGTWAGNISNTTGNSYYLKILDNSNVELLSVSYTATVGAWTQRTQSLSAVKGRNVKIQFLNNNGSTSDLISDLFYCSGGSFTWWDRGASNSVVLDDLAGGRSTIYNGNLVSQSFDTAFIDPGWLASNVTATANGHTISYQTEVSADNSSWDSPVSWTPGSAPTSANKRYIRYTVSFATATAGTALPFVDDVTLSARALTGTFISQIKDIGTTPTSWGNFDADETLNGGTISYFIRAAATSGGVSGASRTALTRGSQIGVTVGQYFRIEADLVASPATDDPTLANFTVNWNEGVVSRTWGSVDKDHRLIWAVAEGASSVPNVTYIYDQRFDTWLKYSVPLMAAARVGDQIYFGSPSAGTIYNYPSGTSDAGSAITAYWKSKDFISGDPFSEKIYRTLDLIADAEAGSNLDVYHSTNGATASSYNFTLTESNGLPYIRNNRNLPSGTFGTFFNVKFGNDDADSPFEVYSIKYDYELKPRRVLP